MLFWPAVVPPGYYLKTPGQVAACPQGEYQDSYVPPSTGVGKCTPCGVGITTSVANAADNRNLCKREYDSVNSPGHSPAPTIHAAV